MKPSYPLVSLLLILFTTFIHAETTWTTGAYSNNEDRREQLSIPNATRLIVTIAGRTERNYDFVYIYDNKGRRVKRLHGAINEKFTVNGSSIIARLRSDYSITESGVTVTIENADNTNQQPITSWTTGAYGNNEDRREQLSIPNATRLIVTVSGETERWYDFIYIYNNRGRRIRRLHGTINQEFTVNGSSITARLRSDYSITKPGVTVTIRDANGGSSDTVKPVITMLGSDVTLTVGDTYTDAGATANDNVDGDITANINTNNPVDTSTAGTYTVTYNVSDATGNDADEVRRTVIVEALVENKVFAFFADEHNDFNNTITGEGTGNRILQIDIENMSLVNSLNVPGILGHHADLSFNSKIYGVPKGSNFVNVIELRRDQNGNTSMNLSKQITLIHKPRSSDAYNSKYNIVLMAAKNRPMASFIDVNIDEVVGTIGEEIDCTLTDGTRLLSHPDANTAEGALKYQCSNEDHGGDQISGHPYWLTEDIAAIIDRTNRQISVYEITQTANQISSRLLNRISTRTSIHQIVPRDRSALPSNQQADFYAIEEGKHADPDDFSGGIAHALIHMRLTTNGLQLVRRMDLQRTEVLPKAKAERILNACIRIYRDTFRQALTGPSEERERRYNDLFNQENITRSTDQDQFNDFPVDCFYPGIPGGHNADFAPNNRHLYIGMAGGAMSVVDVNRWKIANNIDIGIQTGPGHTCFSEKNNVALSSNHGFSNTFGGRAMTRSIRYINSERPIGYYWISLPFDRENITNTAVSHTCHVDASGDNYYNFFTDGGVFYKIDLTGVFNNPTNGSSDLVVDSLYTGGIPIQGSYINLRNIRR
jgi:hypothetical protein